MELNAYFGIIKDMDKPTIEDLKTALEANEPTSTQEVTEEVETVETTEETTTETEDPLKIEVERIRSKKTPQEKAKDSLFFNAQKAKELGIDVAEVLGIKPKEESRDEVEDEDDKPVTRRELEEMLLKSRQVEATKTAEQLVNDIPNELERELTLYHIQNTIKSTGNPHEDLKLARALTNSVRNTQIREVEARKGEAKTHSSASSGGTMISEPTIVFTAEEKAFLATGHISKEDILLARAGKLTS